MAHDLFSGAADERSFQAGTPVRGDDDQVDARVVGVFADAGPGVAEECIGLDPLAEKYKKLDARHRRMKYVKGVSEDIPFPDKYFDVVSSINSLDHVDNLEQTIKEIARVCKPRGFFLLITEFGHEATACEPQTFGLEVIEKISEDFSVESKSLCGVSDDHKLYASLRDKIPYVSGNGFLSAKFIRLPL